MEESKIKYPAFIKNFTSEEKIVDENDVCFGTVADYWQWAHGLLIDNAERGAFAEYLVSKAVGSKAKNRINWDKYDVVSKDGITIEVKASGYIQTWAQKELSSIQFNIRKTHGYNPDNNTYEENEKRQAQVYVFCLHTAKDQENITILKTDGWDFYVLSTKVLNEHPQYSDAKSISLNALVKIGAVKCGYHILYDEIKKVVDNTDAKGEKSKV